MILPKEKVYRYMRHIIMPEISGPGQKKLLESHVAVFAKSTLDASPLMYYLTAAGIGHITAFFEDKECIDFFSETWHDLNPDTDIEIADISSGKNKMKMMYEQAGDFSSQIVFGDIDFINRMLTRFKIGFNGEFDLAESASLVPTIFSVPAGWNGIIQSVREEKGIERFYNFLNRWPRSLMELGNNAPQGKFFSCCLLGALSAIESIKLCLNLGNAAEYPLYFDLLAMDFKRLDINEDGINLNISPTPLKDLSEDINTKLSKSRVLIVGTGGLGSPAAYTLAMAGVGTIGLVDHDRVEISNLNRQILHSTSRIGVPKVKSAELFLKTLNPHIHIIPYETLFTSSNAMDIVKDFDLVIDGLDNLPSRYLLNDVCFFAKKPLAEAGVLRFDGLGMTIVPEEGHCYRCIFPEMPPAGSIPSCSESGILGPVPGVMGTIEAVEAVKLLTGIGKTLQDRLVIFDALALDFKVPYVRRDANCPLCGENPSIKTLLEYNVTCQEGDPI